MEVFMMETHQLNIEGKKDQDASVAGLSDFRYTDVGVVESNVVVENPEISLYCLDDEGKKAIFVELPAGIELTKAPFVYDAQLKNAQRLYAVPYELFTRLASTLPEVHRPIFIHISGRSGSTLLSHVFNDSNVVISLSEPDVVTQFSHLCEGTAGNRDPELQRLAKSTVRFLFRQYHTEDIQAFAVKFRAQGVRVMDLFQDAFPGAKNLFLYRDAVGWATSFARVFRDMGSPESTLIGEWRSEMESYLHTDLSHFMAYLSPGREDIQIVEKLTLWWITTIEMYLEQVERGCPRIGDTI